MSASDGATLSGEDPTDRALDDLFYPGSKKRRPAPVQGPQKAQEDGSWADSPVHRKLRQVRGREMEFFTIGALSIALGKRPVTLRKWIATGVLPDATYRTPPVGNTRGDAGRRLWTRQQIEGLVQIAAKSQVFAKQQLTHSEMDQFRLAVWAWWAEEHKPK